MSSIADVQRVCKFLCLPAGLVRLRHRRHAVCVHTCGDLSGECGEVWGKCGGSVGEVWDDCEVLIDQLTTTNDVVATYRLVQNMGLNSCPTPRSSVVSL